MSNQKDPNSVIQKFYVAAEDVRRATILPKEIEDVKHFLEPGRSDEFLDIGCYDGSKTVILAQFVQAKNVYGVDFLESRLEMAAQIGVKTHWADLNSGNPIPLQDASFDCIYCADVIEHIYSPDFLLQEIHRLLKPSGYALVRTPNLASWRNRISLMLGYQPFYTEVSTQCRLGNPRMARTKPSGHIRVFTPRAMRELIEMSKLKLDLFQGVAINANVPDVIGRVSHVIDLFAERNMSSLCDEMIVKVRRV
jgi:SAM-dependent methyltransferase